jgi:hypothetical protein
MSNSNENKKEVQAWKDFQHKIIYIYEKMFNKSDWLLTEAFSVDVLSKQDYNDRVKTIRNWLNGKTRRPNKFDLLRYKIGEYKMSDGNLLFCEDSFKLWCFEHFKHKVDEYMLIDNTNNTDLSILYVYFFSSTHKKILYHTVHYDTTIKEGECKLFVNNNASWEFTGKHMSAYNSIHFDFQNHEGKKVYYIFDKRDVFDPYLRVLGFQISIDFSTKLPRSSLVMLSLSKLTTDEKMKCRHKLNESNLNIARPFSRKIKSEEEFLYQNFNHKMGKLKSDLSLLSKKSLKQYLIEHLFDSFNSIEKDKNRFDISIGDYFNFLSFSWLPKEKKTDIKWVFNFNYWMFWILSEKVSNPIINKHKQLVKDGFNIEYILVLNSKDKQLKPLTIEKLKEFEACGIKIYITYPYIKENQFLFVDNFSMLMNTSNSMETTISLDNECINNFKERYEKIKAKAIGLDSFMKKKEELSLK